MSKRGRDDSISATSSAAAVKNDETDGSDDENILRSNGLSAKAPTLPARPKRAPKKPSTRDSAPSLTAATSVVNARQIFFRIGGYSTDENNYFSSHSEALSVTANVCLAMGNEPWTLDRVLGGFHRLVHHRKSEPAFVDFVADKYVVGVQTTSKRGLVRNQYPSGWVLDIMSETTVIPDGDHDVVVVAVPVHATSQPNKARETRGRKANPSGVAASSVQLRLPSSHSTAAAVASPSASSSSSPSYSMPMEQEVTLKVFCNGRKYAGIITCDMSQAKGPGKAISDYLADIIVRDPLTFDDMARAVSLVLENAGEIYTPETWMVRVSVKRICTSFQTCL